jgi:hypothetical protein
MINTKEKKDIVTLNQEWIKALQRNNIGCPLSDEAIAVMKWKSIKLRGTAIESSECKHVFDAYLQNMSVIMDRSDVTPREMIEGLQEMEKFLSSVGL